MRSMITNYAFEKSTPTGQPSGVFVFRPKDARYAAYEILDTHLGLKGKDASDYLDKYFDAAFRHYDTAGTGEIEVDRIGGFFRYLTGNMAINLH